MSSMETCHCFVTLWFQDSCQFQALHPIWQHSMRGERLFLLFYQQRKLSCHSPRDFLALAGTGLNAISKTAHEGRDYIMSLDQWFSKVLAGTSHNIAWELLRYVHSRAYWVRNSGCGASCMCGAKSSRSFWSLVKFENHWCRLSSELGKGQLPLGLEKHWGSLSKKEGGYAFWIGSHLPDRSTSSSLLNNHFLLLY